MTITRKLVQRGLLCELVFIIQLQISQWTNFIFLVGRSIGFQYGHHMSFSKNLIEIET